jgi:hypothetical protein
MDRVRAAPRQEDAPAVELVETCWRFIGPTHTVLHCGIYRVGGPGREVGAEYGDDGLLRSQRVRDIEAARAIAKVVRRSRRKGRVHRSRRYATRG